MKIEAINIHNFRSIVDSGDINLNNFSLLAGPNNAGKSNVIAALRILYDEDKFNSSRDFPKPTLMPTDQESWIDVTYSLKSDEYHNLPDYAKYKEDKLKIRKYFKSPDSDKCKSNQSNIYAYERENQISDTLFHGAKNVSEAKLGNLIYIPSVNKTEDILKTSGPSPLRQIATFVFEKVARKSTAFKNLTDAFQTFEKDFSTESTADGVSLTNLVNDINDNLEEWEIGFGVRTKPLRIEDIIKNLLDHEFKDMQLGGEPLNINQCGQGFQRHVIYTLIKLSAKYVEKKESKKKEFSPDYTLILFEEPEAFLHPAQQEILSTSLRELTKNEDDQAQVIITTHSPLFVARNINDLSTIIRVNKENGKTQVNQITDSDENNLLGKNIKLLDFLKTKLSDPSVPETTKTEIRKLDEGLDDSIRIEEESMRYFLWLDSERCSMFFADFVVLCEGPSEKLFLDFMVKTKWNDLIKKRVYFLAVGGKYQMHCYVNLLSLLKIPHSILIDSDGESAHHKFVNEFIETSRTDHTKAIYKLDPDFEGFLGINKTGPGRNHKKPLNIFFNYHQGNITDSKIQEIKEIIEKYLI